MNSTSTYLIISAVAALLLGILKIMYSSKCSKCYGAIDITRDIVSELEEDKYRIDHPPNNNNNSKIPSIQEIV